MAQAVNAAKIEQISHQGGAAHPILFLATQRSHGPYQRHPIGHREGSLIRDLAILGLEDSGHGRVHVGNAYIAAFMG